MTHRTTSARTPTPLKRVIFDQGLVQKDIARDVGIDPAELSRIVNGIMDPGERKARLIASALGETCTALGWPHYEPGAEVAA